MKTFSQLKERIEGFYHHDIVQGSVGIIPYMGDASKWVSDVAKLSNDIKLYSAWKCIGQGENEEMSINQLYNYVSNEERAFFIADSFKKIILCNSRLASSVIAYIMGEIVTNNRNFEHSDAVLYNALLQMTDYDIRNFKYLLENTIGCFSKDDGIIDEMKITQRKESFEITIQICVSAGIFRTENSVTEGENFYTGNFYKVTNIAYSLLKYIISVEQLLNYNM